VQNLALGQALLNGRLLNEGTIIFAHLTEDEMKKLEATPETLMGSLTSFVLPKVWKSQCSYIHWQMADIKSACVPTER
jgi:hypothetical protein